MRQKSIYLLLFIIVMSVASCKKDNWIDWKVQNEAWLAENKTKAGVVTTPSGLQYKVTRKGIAGVRPDALKSVRVNYTGKLITGAVFESNENVVFQVSSVIDGLAEGLGKMYKSGIYTFYIPADLGYGKDEQGSRSSINNYIPPYSTLIFEVELLDVY